VWLGAAGQATQRVKLGTAVTGLIHRYNPVVMAQQIATLEKLFPGRAFLGAGTSEAMNEIPAGLADWPSTGDQLRRAEEALTIITRLLDGETVTFDGEFFKTKRARLYVKPERRPPIYFTAFHEQAAEEAGREAGEIIVQTLASWASTDDAALEGSREWKGTLVDEHYTDPVADPVQVGRNGAAISDTTFQAQTIVASDPEKHVKQIKMMQKLGATAICVMNMSGADPHGTIRTYGEHVLPELRGESG